MNHSDYHGKSLHECLKSEAWNDSIEAHFDKIREYIEMDYDDGRHDRVSEQMLEAAQRLAALTTIEMILDEIVTAVTHPTNSNPSTVKRYRNERRDNQQ